ncbi:Uncharacterised protein [Vibrio cholerae]|nr:Uncharacterised protein [Vibrio cholerae]
MFLNQHRIVQRLDRVRSEAGPEPTRRMRQTAFARLVWHFSSYFP